MENLRNVGQMKSRAWWVDVLVVFAARFLESMQRALGVIPEKCRNKTLSARKQGSVFLAQSVLRSAAVRLRT